MGSAGFLGMGIGALTSGMLADRFGRKPVFQCSMLIWGVGSYLCSIAPDAVTLGVYRVLLGIGMGMELPLAQTILSEFIPAKKRGKYLALMDGNWPIAFICAGVMAYYVLAAFDFDDQAVRRSRASAHGDDDFIRGRARPGGARRADADVVNAERNAGDVQARPPGEDRIRAGCSAPARCRPRSGSWTRGRPSPVASMTGTPC